MWRFLWQLLKKLYWQNVLQWLKTMRQKVSIIDKFLLVFLMECFMNLLNYEYKVAISCTLGIETRGLFIREHWCQKALKRYSKYLSWIISMNKTYDLSCFYEKCVWKNNLLVLFVWYKCLEIKVEYWITYLEPRKSVIQKVISNCLIS